MIVRELIAKACTSEQDLATITLWTRMRNRASSSTSIVLRHHPYRKARAVVKWTLQEFCGGYVRTAQQAKATGDRLRLEAWSGLAELLWPWYSILGLVFLLWLFGLGTMAVNLYQNNMLGVWTFGQFLPPVFLLLPLFDFVNDFSGESPGSFQNLKLICCREENRNPQR